MGSFRSSNVYRRKSGRCRSLPFVLKIFLIIKPIFIFIGHITGISSVCRSSDLVIADFGCGDARLARSVKNLVHSFDLVAVSKEVTACDMAHTSLSNSSVDVVVFCLSLMGNNLASYFMEANRVLKEG